MFIEVTCDGKRVLVNAEDISIVQEGTFQTKTKIVLKRADVELNCTEEYLDIKKALGMTISPRAETLALK